MEETAHREDVVLVQASWNLALPRNAPRRLVKVAALGHQHIVWTKLNARRYAGREFDHGNFRQIEMAVLHIADTQVMDVR